MSGQGVGSVSWTYALVHVSVHFAQAFQQLFDFGGFGLCHLHGRRMIGTGFYACKSCECSEFGIHFSFEFSSLFPPSHDVPFARQSFLSPLQASLVSFPRLSLSSSLPSARTRTSLRASSHVRIRGALGMASTSKGLKGRSRPPFPFQWGGIRVQTQGRKGSETECTLGLDGSVGTHGNRRHDWEVENTQVCAGVIDGWIVCVERSVGVVQEQEWEGPGRDERDCGPDCVVVCGMD